MPRPINSDLRDLNDRPNPLVDVGIELGVPDVGRVHRRGQSLLSGAPLVSMSPASSIAAAPSGALQLTSTDALLAEQMTYVGPPYDLSVENPGRRLKAMGWKLPASYQGATARSFYASVARDVATLGMTFSTDFQLQVYRATGVKGALQLAGGVQKPFINWTHTALLQPAPVVKADNVVWVANIATLLFDLSPYGLRFENIASAPAGDSGVIEENIYYFVLTTIKPAFSNYFKWRTGAPVTGAAGDFRRRWWARDSDAAEWVEIVGTDNYLFSLHVDDYNPAGGYGEAIYSVDLGAVPGVASAGRVVFERSVPIGTNVTADLSTAGSGGPWTAVLNGDVVAIKQQTYHMRVRLYPDAAHRITPALMSFGVEFRTSFDVTNDAALMLPSHDINLPLLDAAVGEAQLTIGKPGARDFDDLMTTIGSTKPATKLEVDAYLRSSHPLITRDKWLRMERLTVSTEEPAEASETLTCLSYASILKRKIPGRVETINSVHAVASATPTQITTSTALPGTSIGGNEYDGKGYYVRVRTGTLAGLVFGVQGSTDTTKLDFSSAIPTLTGGDLIEVHSGVYNVQRVTWQDADVADVWWEVATVYGLVPDDRLGSARVGRTYRAGLPPTLADLAPGDTATQNKLRISYALDEEKELGKVLDELSFLRGGATIEEDGQIVYVQIYPLTKLDGTPMLPLAPSVATFDERDYQSARFPRGLENRITICQCGYGVNKAAANPDATPQKTASAVDSDALNWLAKQDLDQVGNTVIPEEISAWIFNSYDGGLYLASLLCGMLVRACSTGLRVWPLPLIAARPDICLGDVVNVITEGYTDYDPSNQIEIRGRLSVRCIVVGTAEGGRKLRLFVPGLAGNVAQVRASLLGGDTPAVALSPVAITALTKRTLDLDGTPTPVIDIAFTPPSDSRFDSVRVQASINGGTNYYVAAQSATSPITISAAWGETFTIRLLTLHRDGTVVTGSSSAIVMGPTPKFGGLVKDVLNRSLSALVKNLGIEETFGSFSLAQFGGTALGVGKRIEVNDANIAAKANSTGGEDTPVVLGDFTVTKGGSRTARSDGTWSADNSTTATYDETNAGELNRAAASTVNTIDTAAQLPAFDNLYKIKARVRTTIVSGNTGTHGDCEVNTYVYCETSRADGTGIVSHGVIGSVARGGISVGAGDTDSDFVATISLPLHGDASAVNATTGLKVHLWAEVRADGFLPTTVLSYNGSVHVQTVYAGTVEWSQETGGGTILTYRGVRVGKETGKPTFYLQPYDLADLPADAALVEGCLVPDGDAHTLWYYDGTALVDLGAAGGGGGAPTTAEYIVGAMSAGLSAERLATDTLTVDVDLGTAGAAKWHAIGARIAGAVDLAWSTVADLAFVRRSGTNLIGVLFGTTAGTVADGGDARFSDSRTPVAHQLDGALHTVSGLTIGHILQALTGSTFGFALMPPHGSNHFTGGTDPLTPGNINAAPNTPEFVVATAHAGLTAERAISATPTISISTAIAGLISWAVKGLQFGSTDYTFSGSLSSGDFLKYNGSNIVGAVPVAAAHASTHFVGGSDQLSAANLDAAHNSPEFLVAAAAASLLNERVANDTTTVDVDIGTGGVVKWHAVGQRYGATDLANSSTAPTSGQLIAYNGTNLVGVNPQIKKYAAASGACVSDETWLVLAANSGSITGVTLTTVMSITGVGVGRYYFKCLLIYQTTATTTGIDVAANHTGTTTAWLAEHRFASTGQLAATAAAAENAANAAGNTFEAQGGRTKNAIIGAGTVSVDTANADMMSEIEGYFIVSVTGTLEIKLAAEAAALVCTAWQGSFLRLCKLS